MTVQQKALAEQRDGIFALHAEGVATHQGQLVGIPSHRKIYLLAAHEEGPDVLEAKQVIIKDLRAAQGVRLLPEGPLFVVLDR